MYYTKKLWAAGGGGEVVLNFVPFVAPESFDDPQKYADFGCTVNLYEKLKVYKMTYPDADIAVEFTDNYNGNTAYSIAFTSGQIPTGSTIEMFETVLGNKTSVLYTSGGTHAFTSGSTERYMIRRVTSGTNFLLPPGSVWAYCYGISSLQGYVGGGNDYLKYVFFYENTLTELKLFSISAIEGTLRITGGVTTIPANTFYGCTNLTKVITGNNVTTINGSSTNGAFQQCDNLQVADLGTGITSIGTDTFRGCIRLASIICRAYNPPTLATNAFYGIPVTIKFYVPHERVNVYKAANGWSEFASRIYSINDL